MSSLRPLAALAAAVALAMAFFWAALHQIAGVWLDVALRPEVRAALERSMEDQRRLRALDPSNEREYREQFERARTLLNRIEVIRMNRQAVIRRYELILVAAFGVVTAALALALLLRHRRARAREREEYLARLGALQETSRRHAHEIKGPLTAARLEVERLAELARGGAAAADVEATHESILQELERLTRYTREIATFTAIAEPVLRRESLGELVDEFCRTFSAAWPAVELQSGDGDAIACADRDLIRQVLVNLCTNSARAGARTVRIDVRRAAGHATIEVADDGSGIPASVLPHVFDPYVTTHDIGEGMGLGLPIARKVMIGHGGDLEVIGSSSSGTTFRMLFGDDTCS